MWSFRSRIFNRLLLRCALALLLFGGFWWFLQGQGFYQQIGRKVVDYLVKSSYVDNWTSIVEKIAKPDSNLEVEVAGPLSYRFAELPVDGKIVLGFGWQEGENNWPRFSEGIELMVNEGALVRAILPGKVSQSTEDKILGKILVLEHGSDSWSLYGRLGNVGVQEGAEVVAGQPLGSVEGKLFHFEFREGNQLIDPLQKLSSEL